MENPKKSYRQICNEFRWENVFAQCDWNPDQRYNLAHEVCDRYAGDPNRVAVFWLGKNGKEEAITYARLKELSDRFADVLRGLGVQKGDRVAGLLPKVPEVLVTVLGTLKLGAVYVPLFTAFGPNAVEFRLNHCQAKAVVSNNEYLANIKAVSGALPELKHIINIDGSGATKPASGEISFWDAMTKAASTFPTQEMQLDDLAIIQYTSGSTGLPKGAMWSHKVMCSIYPYLKYALGLQPADLYWGAADPGWAFGLMACLLGPLAMGNSIVFCEIPFSPEVCYQVLEKYRVTNFAYAPTAYRAMMAFGDELSSKYQIKLRAASSAGEPLNPEAIDWFKKNFGVTICDQYGCTEMLMLICNFNASDMQIKVGSMGLPTPGFEVDLLDDEGNKVPVGQLGQIACNTGGAGTAFLGYLHEPEKTQERFKGSWYLPGDLAVQDEDGYFWFQGRDDDIISCAGYRIGPFEIESTLLEHPAVAEAAVVGISDELKGEAIKGYVVLKPSYNPSPGLTEELILYVKNKLAKHQMPKVIEFVDTLPKTPSGKILRYVLRDLAK